MSSQNLEGKKLSFLSQWETKIKTSSLSKEKDTFRLCKCSCTNLPISISSSKKFPLKNKHYSARIFVLSVWHKIHTKSNNKIRAIARYSFCLPLFQIEITMIQMYKVSKFGKFCGFNIWQNWNGLQIFWNHPTSNWN